MPHGAESGSPQFPTPVWVLGGLRVVGFDRRFQFRLWDVAILPHSVPEAAEGFRSFNHAGVLHFPMPC